MSSYEIMCIMWRENVIRHTNLALHKKANSLQRERLTNKGERHDLR